MSWCSDVQTINRARKQHRCCWCGETIEPGDSYVSWFWSSGGDADQIKMHPECRSAMDRDQADSGDGCYYIFDYDQHRRGCTCDRWEQCADPLCPWRENA